MLEPVKPHLLMGMILLAACADFESRPLVPADNLTQLEARSLADPALREFVDAYGERDLADQRSPTWDLDTLTLAALFFNPDLDVARAEWAAAEAARIAAGERPNPMLSVAPGYNATNSDPSPRIATTNLDLTFETAGKRKYRVAQAAELSEAALLGLDSVAWQVRSQVRSRLLDLYGAREVAALLGAQQEIHAQNLQILEARYREGAASGFELSQAQSAASGARLALRDAETQNVAALNRLAESIGVPVAALQGIEMSFDTFAMQLPAEPTESMRRQALLNRADLLAALSEYAASQSQLQLEIARQYPDIHLGPGYEYDQGDDKWSLTLAATLPIFSRNAGAIAEAEARRDEAAARFNALQASVLAEIDVAIAGFRSAVKKQADARKMLTELSRQEEIARSMLAAGGISRGDLARLQLQLNASALARLDATIQVQRAAGQLEDALQVSLGPSSAAWHRAPRVARSADGEHQS